MLPVQSLKVHRPDCLSPRRRGPVSGGRHSQHATGEGGPRPPRKAPRSGPDPGKRPHHQDPGRPETCPLAAGVPPAWQSQPGPRGGGEGGGKSAITTGSNKRARAGRGGGSDRGEGLSDGRGHPGPPTLPHSYHGATRSRLYLYPPACLVLTTLPRPCPSGTSVNPRQNSSRSGASLRTCPQRWGRSRWGRIRAPGPAQALRP